MARSLNRATLIGHVGGVPEVRTVGTGGRAASFSLATSRQWTDQQGNKQEKTEWHRCMVWNRGTNKLADVVEQYVSKGDKLWVEGEITYRQWTDKDGQTRYTTEIVVRELIMLGNGRGQSDDSAPRERSSTSAKKPAAPSAPADNDFSDFPGALADDDDIPF